MHVFEIMAEPVRRRIVEILASGMHSSGDIELAIRPEFGISRAAVSHHLKVLRDHGAVTCFVEWPYHEYELEPQLFVDIMDQVEAYSELFQSRIGGHLPGDPALSVPGTRRGRRGRGIDPDTDSFRRNAEERARLLW